MTILRNYIVTRKTGIFKPGSISRFVEASGIAFRRVKGIALGDITPRIDEAAILQRLVRKRLPIFRKERSDIGKTRTRKKKVSSVSHR